MKNQDFYSDEDNFIKSNQQVDSQQKAPQNNRQLLCYPREIFKTDNLLKDSGLSGIPLQKHKYANKIKNISTEIVSKDLVQKIQITLKKQTSVSSIPLNNPNNFQDDGTSSVNCPQNNKSVSALDKRQRNKQSAKLSRDRKKLYIEMLQQKQKALTKKLLSKKKELQQTKNYLDRVINQNKAMSGFTASRHQMIKNLQNVLQNKQLASQQRDSQINKIIDNLRYRIGAAGKQRINTINQYFRQIVNLSLPALHRYMMWSAAQQNHLFSQNQEQETDDWYKELKNSLNLTQEQRKEVQSKKTFLQEQKKVLEKLIGKLKSIKTQIEQKSIQLEDLIEEIRSILTPVQCAHFILFIEKNKYRKELNLCDQLQQESRQKIRMPDAELGDSGPRKILKTPSNSS